MLWRKLPGNVAKVGVGGSNPLARSKFPIDINPLLADGPEQGLVHWREVSRLDERLET